MRFMKIFFALILIGCLLYIAAYLYSTNQSAQVEQSLSAAVQAKREQQLFPKTESETSVGFGSLSSTPSISIQDSLPVGFTSPGHISEESNADQGSLLKSIAPSPTFSPKPEAVPVSEFSAVASLQETPILTPSPLFTASPSFAPVPVSIQTDTPAPAIVPSSPAAPSPIAALDAGVLPEYEMLLEQNADIIGWITVEDTPIDYPVMFTPDDPEFYLHRSFEKTVAFSGTPFLDARCDPDAPSDNLIIYGHNMRNGSMFGTLKHFQEEEYFLAHPFLRFDTLHTRSLYQIFAVIPIKLEELTHERMRCYSISLTEDALQIDTLRDYVLQYAVQCRPEALPKVHDQVVTLSTCTGFRRSNRLVIMAVRIEDPDLPSY